MKLLNISLVTAVFAVSCMTSGMHAKISTVKTEAELDTILNNGKKPYTVVKFWKEECQPCEELAPHFEKVASELHNKVNFVAVEGPSELSRKYKIGGFPKTLYFKNGKKMSKDGTRNVNRLKEDIQGAFGL